MKASERRSCPTSRLPPCGVGAAKIMNARAGERILDVATGTGWSARNVARLGAVVMDVDISPELSAAATDLSGAYKTAN